MLGWLRRLAGRSRPGGRDVEAELEGARRVAESDRARDRLKDHVLEDESRNVTKGLGVIGPP